MPVTGFVAGAAALAAVALLAAGTAFAQAAAPAPPSMETIMYHLDRDKRVRKAQSLYGPAVQAAMLYSRCAQTYAVDTPKEQWQAAEIARGEAQLRAAYIDAHQELTRKLPNEATLAVINTAIDRYRNEEAVQVGQLIATNRRGCGHYSLRDLDAYFVKKRALAVAQAAELREEQSIEKESY